jgi:hypothetical protein
MTYYEWVEYIEELKDKTITNEIINKINNYNFDYSQDVMIRLTDHIIGLIFKKLDNQMDYLIDNINNIKSPHELTLQINDIKETLNDSNKLLEIKYFEDELINDLKNQIVNYSNEYIDIIKSHYNGTINNEYSVILNGLNLMEEK